VRSRLREKRAETGQRLWRRHRVISVVAVIVVLAGVGGGIWAGTSGGSKSPTTTTETVSTTTIRQTVSASGTLATANEADLSFAAAGQVSAVLVQPGDKVAKGQPLAKITSASLAAQVASAQVSVASAQSRLSTDETAAATAAQISADQQSLTVAQDSLNDANTALAGATMTAPFAGVVATVDLTNGQQLSGSSSSSSSSGSGGSGGSGGTGSGGGTGSTISAASVSSSTSSSSAQIVVIDPDHFTVSATVDDTEIASIKPNLQAVITPNGSSSVVYGTVSSVGMIASSTSGVTTYPITIAVTGSQPTLHDGASASVSIVVKQLSDVLAVPTTALHYNGTKVSVIRVINGRDVSTPVTIGQVSGVETQIMSGLSTGQTIVIPVTRRAAGARTGTGTGTRGGFGGGGFGGGGFGGGGFGGGGVGGGVGGGGLGAGGLGR
jgi:macrolide-specific efflux system membrane fusion protein